MKKVTFFSSANFVMNQVVNGYHCWPAIEQGHNIRRSMEDVQFFAP